MRIKLLFSGSEEILPINNQHIVNSYIHKCLGENNEYHDTFSKYSISSLQGGKWIKGTRDISFENGGYLVVSSEDMTFLNKLMMSCFNNPILTKDIKFKGIENVDEKFYNGWNHFATLSPFLIKEYNDGKYEFITYGSENFEQKVLNHIVKKINRVDSTIDTSEIEVQIPNKPSFKVKSVLVKNVINKANQCQVSIKCTKGIAELIYNLGLGQSTGCGFGTIYKTENHRLYRNRI